MVREFKTVVFDFGGVLIDWNRRYLYKKVFNDEARMEWFLKNVCSDEWNNQQDAGVPFKESIPALQKKFPEYADQIAMYETRWEEMVGGPITGSVDILKEIQAKGYPVYGLTNWGADTFPIVFKRYEFLRALKGIVISGVEKKVKPFPEIFQILIDRYPIDPQSTVYIDDNSYNVQTARSFGFETIQFESPEHLRQKLELLKVL